LNDLNSFLRIVGGISKFLVGSLCIVILYQVVVIVMQREERQPFEQ
jgi:hypothetical protein